MDASDFGQAPGQASLDRRRLLRQGAAAGAVVWMAPTVVTSPAAAQTGTGVCEFDEVEIVGVCEPPFAATIQWSVSRACADARVRVEIDGEPQEPCFDANDSIDIDDPLFGAVTVTVILLSNCEGDELDVRNLIVSTCFG